ncbi:MAG TPA: choice-of-anchor D domain-containing protein, partial [Polyangiaceae bacterium]|nr:choice-of-anchor D domain-containing protein [Polyangiaceae bacterium]
MNWKLRLRSLRLWLLLLSPLLLAAQCERAALQISEASEDAFYTSVGIAKSHTFVVTNVGAADATIEMLEFDYVSPNWAFTGGTCAVGKVVAASGGTCTVVVTYKPRIATTIPTGITGNGFEILYSWSGDASARAWVRTGFSAAGLEDVSFVPRCLSDVSYGTRPLGSSTSRTLTLTNFGSAEAVFAPLTSESLGLTPPFSLSGGTCGSTLAPGAACTLTFAFAPTTAGAASSEYAVKYRYPGEAAERTVAVCRLSATGAAPLALSRGTDFDFKQLSRGSVATETLDVTNWNDEAVTLGPLTNRALGLAAPFSVTGGTCHDAVLSPAGGSCTLQLAYAAGFYGPSVDRLELGYRLASGGSATATLGLSGTSVVRDPVRSVAMAGSHICALLASGNVRCWGEFEARFEENIELPYRAGNIDIGGPVVQLALGVGHTCALLSTGNVRCWGYNIATLPDISPGSYTSYPGILGYPNGDAQVGDDETPASVGDVNVGGGVVQLAAGAYHTC